MSKQNVYVVTMYRWGSRENHSYVLGVYTKKSLALKEAEKEQTYRGGVKYYPEVLEVELNNSTKASKVILELGKNPDFLSDEEKNKIIGDMFKE